MRYYCIRCLEQDSAVSVLMFVESGELKCNTCGCSVVDSMPCYTRTEMVYNIRTFMNGCPKEDKEHWKKCLDKVNVI